MPRHLLLLSLLWLSARPVLHAQSPGPVDSTRADKNERPDKPKVIVEADQRFFYFKDGTPPLLRNPANIWGARAGLLLPSNVKIGVGYYFAGQAVNESWAEQYRLVHRQLRYGTVYVEPYLYRRRYWELSFPLEAGLGAARYRLSRTDNQQPDVRRAVAVPLSAGLSVAIKFPTLFGFKPLRWFGVNLMSGYRYTLQRNVPRGPATLNGFYYSISPAIFLDRIYQDVGSWRGDRHGVRGGTQRSKQPTRRRES